MINTNSYTAKPSVIASFKQASGFDLIDAFKAEPVKSQKACFKTREVSEDINKRLLSLQGVTAKNIRLYNSKEEAPADCKTVFLVITLNDYTIKSFYSARYTAESEPKKQVVGTAVKVRTGAKTINDTKKADNKPVSLVPAENLESAEVPAILETVSISKVEYMELLDKIEKLSSKKKGLFTKK